ncbi:glycerol-3-phosphate responsive antiterminator [Mycoplasmatota bacterium]|nr:glycerol-3-phosphate responsive antiterminator [Mycoplasmatota bacterium]
MFYNQQIIPAIPNHQAFKKFIDSKYTYGILMGFQLSQLKLLVDTCHQAHKKVLIHSELIKGLSHDEYGAIFLIQELKVDGLISSKPKVIELCKKRNVIGIFRFFLKDSISLEQSLAITRKIEPIYLEVLPATGTKMIPYIKDQVHAEILMGGLIQNKEQIQDCVSAGAIAVTISNTNLW